MTEARLKEIETEYKNRYGNGYKEVHEIIAAFREHMELARKLMIREDLADGDGIPCEYNYNKEGEESHKTPCSGCDFYITTLKFFCSP